LNDLRESLHSFSDFINIGHLCSLNATSLSYKGMNFPCN
jgi:hypothetical protein